MSHGPSIASLIPSGTDIVVALGLSAHLVGVSHECDQPVAAGLPVLTSSTLTAEMSAPEIDQAVSESVAEGRSLYRTDAATLTRLAPAVILSQDVCDVCAVNGEVAAADVPAGSDLVMLTAVRLRDLWDDLARVGHATGSEAAAASVTQASIAELDRVAATVIDAPRRRVVALDWGQPLFAAGHWVPDLIRIGGGEDVLATSDPMSRRVRAAEVDEAEPEVVLFVPCGYGLDQAVAEVTGSALSERCSAQGVELWALDATRLFSRCTPQAVVAGADVVSRVLHPARSGAPAPTDAHRVV